MDGSSQFLFAVSRQVLLDQPILLRKRGVGFLFAVSRQVLLDVLEVSGLLASLGVSIRCFATGTSRPHHKKQASDKHQREQFTHPTTDASRRRVFGALVKPNSLVRAIHTRRRFPCFARSPPFAVPEVVDGQQRGGTPPPSSVVSKSPGRAANWPAAAVCQCSRSIGPCH